MLQWCLEWARIQCTIQRLANGLECIRIHRHFFQQCIHQRRCRIQIISPKWAQEVVIVADIHAPEVDEYTEAELITMDMMKEEMMIGITSVDEIIAKGKISMEQFGK